MAGYEEFRKRLTEDETFLKKMQEIGSVNELIEAAKEEGFTLTVDDIKELFALSGEELENVAGGIGGIGDNGIGLEIDIVNQARTRDGMGGFGAPR